VEYRFSLVGGAARSRMSARAVVWKAADAGAIWIPLFIVVAVVKTLATKDVYSAKTTGFGYPATLTTLSCVTTNVVLGAMFAAGLARFDKPRAKDISMLAWVSLFTAINLLLMNMALNAMSVAMHQVLRAAGPAVVLPLEILVLGKNPFQGSGSIFTAIGVAMMLIGPTICIVFGWEGEDAYTSILYVAGALVANAFNIVVSTTRCRTNNGK